VGLRSQEVVRGIQGVMKYGVTVNLVAFWDTA